VEWKKIPDAAREWAGGVSSKTLYAAIKKGDCLAARIGTGRNMLVCEEYIDAYLRRSAEQKSPETGR
jgi:hypothetical protein